MEQLTKRDIFAALAMHAILVGLATEPDSTPFSYEDIEEDATIIADKMLKALGK